MIFIELEVIDNNEDHEADWPIKDIIEAIIRKNYLDQQSSHTQNCENSAPYESLSLKNREIFETAVNTPKGVKSVGYE